MKMSPTEYFKRNFLVACRADEPTLPAAVDLLGGDNFCWNTDYPHPDGTWETGLADFERQREPKGGPVEIPISSEDALGNEWAVVVDSPGYCACLLAWEQLGVTEPDEDPDLDRRFEAIWTLDPIATRRASQAAARLVSRCDPKLGAEIDELLIDRPLAFEEPSPALTALTNRVVAYLDAA